MYLVRVHTQTQAAWNQSAIEKIWVQTVHSMTNPLLVKKS